MKRVVERGDVRDTAPEQELMREMFYILQGLPRVPCLLHVHRG